MRSFVRIESSRNGEITLSFTDIGKSCPSSNVLTSQICLLTLFAKISESTVSSILSTRVEHIYEKIVLFV